MNALTGSVRFWLIKLEVVRHDIDAFHATVFVEVAVRYDHYVSRLRKCCPNLEDFILHSGVHSRHSRPRWDDSLVVLSIQWIFPESLLLAVP